MGRLAVHTCVQVVGTYTYYLLTRYIGFVTFMGSRDFTCTTSHPDTYTQEVEGSDSSVANYNLSLHLGIDSYNFLGRVLRLLRYLIYPYSDNR